MSHDEYIDRYYLANIKTYNNNDIVFQKLKIINMRNFVQSVYGYTSSGRFPYAKTLEDLNKMIDKLQELCQLK